MDVPRSSGAASLASRPLRNLRIARSATMMPESVLSSSSVISLRLQSFNRLGAFNLLCENQPSLSRRSEFFAMHRIAFGLDHFAFGDLPTFRLCKEGHFPFAFAANAASSALGSSNHF